MAALSVVLITTDNEQRAILQALIDGTSVARTVHTCAAFPAASADPVMRRIQSANPDVIIVDIPDSAFNRALDAIELLHHEIPDTALFGIGDIGKPQVIVGAMRAGAREFLERPTTTTDLL